MTETAPLAESRAAFYIENGAPHIADRAFLWATDIDVRDLPSGIDTEYHARGFHLMMESGYTLSVQFGSTTYSSNRDHFDGKAQFSERAATAEIAAWDSQGTWLTWADGDEVQGWQTPEQVLAVFDALAAGQLPEGARIGGDDDADVRP